MRLSLKRLMIWCFIAILSLQGLATAAYAHCMARGATAGLDHAHHGHSLTQASHDPQSQVAHAPIATVPDSLAAAPPFEAAGVEAMTDLGACTSCPICCQAPGIVSEPYLSEQIRFAHAPPLTIERLAVSFLAEGPERPPRLPRSPH